MNNTEKLIHTMKRAEKEMIEMIEYDDYIMQISNDSRNFGRKRSRRHPFITPEQYKRLKIIDAPCSVNMIAKEINRVISENVTRLVQGSWINKWLLALGMLTINDNGDKIATELGISVGITTEFRLYGEFEHFVNLYSQNAQRFIFDNIMNIIELHYNH